MNPEVRTEVHIEYLEGFFEISVSSFVRDKRADYLFLVVEGSLLLEFGYLLFS